MASHEEVQQRNQLWTPPLCTCLTQGILRPMEDWRFRPGTRRTCHVARLRATAESADGLRTTRPLAQKLPVWMKTRCAATAADSGGLHPAAIDRALQSWSRCDAAKHCDDAHYSCDSTEDTVEDSLTSYRRTCKKKEHLVFDDRCKSLGKPIACAFGMGQMRLEAKRLCLNMFLLV